MMDLAQDTLVILRLNLSVLPKQRIAVDCRACGPHIQHTGEGGFADPAEAVRFAQDHRRAHIEALQREIAQADKEGTS